MRGWVYVISNDSMLPDLFKLGFSMKDPELRAKELGGSGMPTPYLVRFVAMVDSPKDLEQFLHLHFKDYHHGKEWFKLSIDKLIPELEKVLGDEILYKYSKVDETTKSNKSKQSDSIREDFKQTEKLLSVCQICGESYKYNNIHECIKNSWPTISCKGCRINLRVPPDMDMLVKCPECKVKFKVHT